MIELEKYTYRGEFTFSPTDRLSQVCNAPFKYGELYLIYANKKGISELVYVGISGKLDKITGKLISRQDGLESRIVRGKRDGEQRKDFWIREMLENHIDSLRICWLVVHDEDKFQDCPEHLKGN